MTTVLVVDDEPDVRLIARLVLVSGGHDVVEAGSGEEALALLDDGSLPDAVLLDIRMPGIDGWEVLRRVRGDPALEHLPVIVFTAHVSTREEAPPASFSHFVKKPFSPDDLLRAVEAAMAPL